MLSTIGFVFLGILNNIILKDGIGTLPLVLLYMELWIWLPSMAVLSGFFPVYQPKR